MEWIKKNPHQLALAICSVGLIGASVSILLNAQSFPQKFTTVRLNAPESNKVPPLELGPVQQAQERIDKPSQWSPENGAAALFIPPSYADSQRTVAAC